VTVVVMGRPALTCELLARALDGVQTNEGSEDVVVLVDPAPSEWIRARELSARIVLLGRDSGAEAATEMVLAGADAVVEPETSLDGLCEVVRIVASGGTLLTPRQARLLVEGARAAPSVAPGLHLTRRESEILECIDMGLSVKQTARHLGIADKTVENMRSRLFRKLGARNGGHALVSASNHGVRFQRT
jgi:DNA-binding NarL/FixJ family response regulator